MAAKAALLVLLTSALLCAGASAGGAPRGLAKPKALNRAASPHNKASRLSDGTVPTFTIVSQEFHEEPRFMRRALRGSSSGRRILQDGNVTFHDGTIMRSGAYLVNIFLGQQGNNTWAGKAAADKDLVSTFAFSLGSASVIQRLKAYKVKPFISLHGTVVMDVGGGAALTVELVQKLVRHVIDENTIPKRLLPDTIINVISDRNWTPWNETWMCIGGCISHDNFLYDGAAIKYTWVVSPSACDPIRNNLTAFGLPGGTAPCHMSVGSGVRTPHRSEEADSTVNTIYRGILNVLTEPLAHGGWYDNYFDEMGEECAGDWGDYKTFSDPACNCTRAYNLEFGGQKWLLQGFWDATSQSCMWS